MLLQFDFSDSVPLYMQIRNQIVIGIAEKKLLPGEKLPTIRSLAQESGINMMTVSKAYQLLKQEGYIVTDRRNGAAVAGSCGEKQVPDKVISELRLCLSELRLSGISQEDAISLCRELYEEGCEK